MGGFVEVLGQGDANRLEHRSDLTRDMGPGGDGLAVLLDGGLLEAIKIIEQWLPFGLQVLNPFYSPGVT